jgi:hypothetical protein
MPKKRKPRIFDDIASTRNLALLLAEIQGATDSIVLLVRGAIALDNMLTELLDRALHFEKNAHNYDKTYRLFFAGKCDLAMASGLLSKDEWKVLRVFNSFRNRAAHGFDVHVHEDEVEALVKRFEEYGWSVPTRKEPGDEPSLIDILRAMIVSLVGLLMERIGQIDRCGKVEIRGEDFNKDRWVRVYTFGASLAMTTISAERVISARNEAAQLAMRRVMQGLETDTSLAELTDEELTAEINRRLGAERDLDLSEAIELAQKEAQAIADTLGRKYKITLGYTPGPMTVKLSRRGGSPTK